MACAESNHSGLYQPNHDQGSIQAEAQGVQGDLVFLYKLRPGPCPKSYGLQVAHMAGVPPSIIQAAWQAAQSLEGKLRIKFESGIKAGAVDLLSQRIVALAQSPLLEGRGEALHQLSEDARNEVVEELSCLWHEIKAALHTGRV